MLQNEKLARLREKLLIGREQCSLVRAKIVKVSHDLKVKHELFETALSVLEKIRTEQLEKFYPNLICVQRLGLGAITSERLHKQSLVIKQIWNLFQHQVCINAERKYGSVGQYDQIYNTCLPQELDPHSVPPGELSAALGYMVQLLNLIVQNVAAPALHNSGFVRHVRPYYTSIRWMVSRLGSCSRIWQRSSYWDAHPSCQSNEYPLFIPRQNSCVTGGEASWSGRSSSNFCVTSIEYDRKACLNSSGSFNHSPASPHSVKRHQDLQKGISLLKKSVACVTAYCYNSLCLDVPADTSTFEAFFRLLATLSSFREAHSTFSLKMDCSRSLKQVGQMNKSVWGMNSAILSSTWDNAHGLTTLKNPQDDEVTNSSTSFLFATESSSDIGKSNNDIEGWYIVEHPAFPPPPSQTEDVEHWTRAMFTDATKK
ncbi:hypothetical protein NMG60_11031471 [Bertholletia excelsa]